MKSTLLFLFAVGLFSIVAGFSPEGGSCETLNSQYCDPSVTAPYGFVITSQVFVPAGATQAIIDTSISTNAEHALGAPASLPCAQEGFRLLCTSAFAVCDNTTGHPYPAWPCPANCATKNTDCAALVQAGLTTNTNCSQSNAGYPGLPAFGASNTFANGVVPCADNSVLTAPTGTFTQSESPKFVPLTGTCQTLASSSYCYNDGTNDGTHQDIFDINFQVWIPDITDQATVEVYVQTYASKIALLPDLVSSGVLTQVEADLCLQQAPALACSAYYPKCDTGASGGLTPLPQYPCLTACDTVHDDDSCGLGIAYAIQNDIQDPLSCSAPNPFISGYAQFFGATIDFSASGQRSLSCFDPFSDYQSAATPTPTKKPHHSSASAIAPFAILTFILSLFSYLF